MSKNERQAAFKDIDVEIDVGYAHSTFLLILANEAKVDENMTMLKHYCNIYHEWRRALSQYYSNRENKAKESLIRIFFGSLPRSDLPFLWKLRDEVEQAVDAFLVIEKYENLEGMFF